MHARREPGRAGTVTRGGRVREAAWRRHAAHGSALLIVVVALMVLSAMGLGLVLLATTETLAAANRRRGAEVLYAAEAGLERVLPELLRAPDWDAALDGRLRSGFVDGPPSGSRQLAGGRSIDLDEIVNVANCGRPTACSAAAMDAVTEARPWGADNPRWRLFAHGPLAALAGAGDVPPVEYLVVLVGDDPAEADHDPGHDGRPPANPGAGVVALRAEAFGPDGAHRAVEAIAARGSAGIGPAGYLAQKGQGGGAGPAGGPVQVPGASLSRSEMTLAGGLAGR